VEALTDGDGSQANTIAEKKEMLSWESIPPNDVDQYQCSRHAGPDEAVWFWNCAG
jgi:hypothetical protein